MAITLRQAAAGLALNEFPGLAAATAKAIGEFNRTADKLRERIAAQPDVDALIERASQGDVDAVISYIDSGTFNVVGTAGELLRLWQQRRELAATAAGELRTVSEKAEQNHIKATADARTKIEAAGLTASCMPGAAENGAAAEIRFRNTILNLHPLVQKSAAAAHDAKNIAQVMGEAVQASCSGAKAVSDLLRVLARRQLSGAVA